MNTIKTWQERIKPEHHGVAAFAIAGRDAEIAELREALKVAHTEIANRNQRALDGDKIVYRVNELCDEVDALQAKLAALLFDGELPEPAVPASLLIPQRSIMSDALYTADQVRQAIVNDRLKRINI